VSANTRRARLAMAVGAVLLAIAAALTLWDLSAGDAGNDPVPVTGQVDSP
jgi:hypothetical protein